MVIYDIAGQVVTQESKLVGPTITLRRNNLDTGLYFLKLSGRKVYFGKFIIE